MRLIGTRSAMFTLIGILLLNAVHADSVPQKQTLPRSFGPLTLGMTEDGFKKVTGTTKTDFCAHCADDESVMSVDAEELPGVFPAYIYKLPEYTRTVVGFFYKGKLYRIETSPEIGSISAAKNKYSELFGPPKIEDWKNGLSFAIWENKTTAFVLTYVRKQDKDHGYPLTMPVGTVSHVEYIDKPLRDALEAQEKKHPTRTHH
jgi:hypothetical protein